MFFQDFSGRVLNNQFLKLCEEFCEHFMIVVFC